MAEIWTNRSFGPFQPINIFSDVFTDKYDKAWGGEQIIYEKSIDPQKEFRGRDQR